MDILTFNTRAAMMQALADRVAQQLDAGLKHQRHVSMAVPGGTTPAPFFTALSKHPLDWARVNVMPSDERLVPMDHPRSNARMICDSLGQGAARAMRFIPLYDHSRDHIAIDDVNAALPLDLAVVGMGADMHFASLFPDSAALADALVSSDPLMGVAPASQSEQRVSLTGPVFLTCPQRYILIQGAEKLDALKRAQAINDPHIAPISLILRENTTVYFAS